MHNAAADDELLAASMAAAAGNLPATISDALSP